MSRVREYLIEHGENEYIRFYPVKVLKCFLKQGDIKPETFKFLVKEEYWPKELKERKV